MRKTRIYHNDDIHIGKVVELDQDVSHYLIRVLRMEDEDKLLIFNGSGKDFEGSLDIKGRRAFAIIESEHETHTESPVEVHIFQSLSKADKIDFAIQKSVELGACSFTPLMTEFSERKFTGTRLENKLRHFRGIVIAAAQQSCRGVIPTVHEPVSFKDFTSQKKHTPLVFTPKAKDSIKAIPQKTSYAIAIGPEGGFSKEELELCQSENIQLISMGPRILRTETAPIAILSTIQTLFGDF